MQLEAKSKRIYLSSFTSKAAKLYIFGSFAALATCQSAGKKKGPHIGASNCFISRKFIIL